MRSASQDFRDLLDAAHKNQESLVRVLVSADSVMSRIANRSGTLGLLVSDSTLYRETTLTMIQLRQLLSDIQANPQVLLVQRLLETMRNAEWGVRNGPRARRADGQPRGSNSPSNSAFRIPHSAFW